MSRRVISLFVLIGLFFGTVVMPVVAHAGGQIAVHANEMLDVHDEVDVDHSQSKNGDGNMPCHAVSHHHCSIALQLEAPRVILSGQGKALLVSPAATSGLVSYSQAPPLDPPNA
ncbi:MAG: hypothetical protein ACKVOJ_04000 [Sphingomonadaceae bacterium]